MKHCAKKLSIVPLIRCDKTLCIGCVKSGEYKICVLEKKFVMHVSVHGIIKKNDIMHGLLRNQDCRHADMTS